MDKEGRGGEERIAEERQGETDRQTKTEKDRDGRWQGRREKMEEDTPGWS